MSRPVAEIPRNGDPYEDNLDSLVTAFRYAIESDDAVMEHELIAYAASQGLSDLEIKSMRGTAEDEQNQGIDWSIDNGENI